MERKPLIMLALLLLTCPLAAAQAEGEVNATDELQETTLAGMSTTVVIILIVLSVLVVALVVAMASRP